MGLQLPQLFLISQGVSGLSSLAGGIAQAGALRAQGRLESQLFESQARMSEIQALDATQRGEFEAARQRMATRQLIGRQRAAFGAQGVSLEAGSPQRAVEESMVFGRLDELTIRSNAFREALGFRAQAVGQRFQSAITRISSKAEARQTLLTGGLEFARSIQEGVIGFRELGGGRGGRGSGAQFTSETDRVTPADFQRVRGRRPRFGSDLGGTAFA